MPFIILLKGKLIKIAILFIHNIAIFGLTFKTNKKIL